MTRSKVEFANAQGHNLAGLLELPGQGKPRAMALFAHCFTCGKDIAAASRIGRALALAKHGIGVLRFDFTGLGSSDGDFGNTSFSSNIEDLLAAAQRMPSIEAVATIGGPRPPLITCSICSTARPTRYVSWVKPR